MPFDAAGNLEQETFFPHSVRGRRHRRTWLRAAGCELHAKRGSVQIDVTAELAAHTRQLTQPVRRCDGRGATTLLAYLATSLPRNAVTRPTCRTHMSRRKPSPRLCFRRPSDDSRTMIHVENLTKFYGDYAAVRDVSFDVDRGQVVGFLGPNGAGKSTTMRILTGYLTATSGKASIDGKDVFWDPIAARRRIGYLSEGCPLYARNARRRISPLPWRPEGDGRPRDEDAGLLTSSIAAGCATFAGN